MTSLALEREIAEPSFVVDNNSRCAFRREKHVNLVGAVILADGTTDDDADVADLDDAFSGLAKKGELHHASAKLIERRFAGIARDRFQDHMFGPN